MGTLFIVATPIGHLEDITLRALRVLREADWVAAEDTRRARALLAHYDIPTGKVVRYDEHSHARQAPRVLNALAQGQRVALVSDAGTPVLNDPGLALVQAAWQAGHRVVPIPGPNAAVAALSAAGVPAVPYLYLGYPPRKAAARRRWLDAVATLPVTLVLLEAPHRLHATLQALHASLGPHRTLVIAREVTKAHEEFWRGTVAEAVHAWAERAPRGEFTLVVGPPPASAPAWSDADLDAAIAAGLAAGEAPSALARRLAQASGRPRGEVYRRVLTAQDAATDPRTETPP